MANYNTRCSEYKEKIIQQAHVPDGARIVRWVPGGGALRGTSRRGAGGRQALSLRLSSLIMAGSGQGGPSRACSTISTPRLSLLR